MPLNFDDLKDHQKKCVNMVNSLGSKISKYIDRIEELGRTYRNTAIGVFDIDDEFGRYLTIKATQTSNEEEWGKIRADNKIPLCFGLVDRQMLQEELNERGLTVAKVLEDTDEIAIVGVGFGTVIIFGVNPNKLDSRPGGN